MRICILPGDGIGPEVMESAVDVLKAIGDFEFAEAEIGFACYQKNGTPLPERTLELIRDSDAALFAAVTTPPDIPDYTSPVLGFRQALNLYANVRPIKYLGIGKDIDIVIFRENTEGLYSGRERVEGDTAITERVITRQGSERIIRAAFEYCQKNNRKRLHLIHKANVMRQTCGLFRRVGQELAKEYPGIEYREMIVDACAMALIKDPAQFDVIVTTNMFGDILSDEASMLVGGLGLAASGNLGEHAVFEPVHGSAPDITGKGIANPMAMLMAADMMLRHLGLESGIESAVKKTISQGRTTPDMGGNLSTKEVTKVIIENLK